MSVPTLLLYSQSTGQVLAGTTTVSAESSTPTADVLAGPFLPVRYLGTPGASGYASQVWVPAANLAVFATDSQTVAIDKVRDWFVAQDAQGKQTLKPQSPTDLGGPTLPTAASPVIGVKVTPTSTDKLSFLAVVHPASPSDPTQLSKNLQAVSQDLTPTATGVAATVSLALVPLPAGAYSALILVTGFRPYLASFTI